MSGGSWEYVYLKFEETADHLLASNDAHRNALGELICLVSKAMHDIEWVDSGDYVPGDEYPAIDKAVKFSANTSEMGLEMIRHARKNAQRFIAALDILDPSREQQ